MNEMIAKAVAEAVRVAIQATAEAAENDHKAWQDPR